MTFEWNTVATETQLKDYHNMTAKIDYAFAQKEKAFYKSRTVNDLKSLARQAWNCNQVDSYVLANSYLALISVD